MADESTKVPDPATSYERAKPEKESPEGKLDGKRPQPEREEDHLQQHNAQPNEKHAQQKRPTGATDSQ